MPRALHKFRFDNNNNNNKDRGWKRGEIGAHVWGQKDGGEAVGCNHRGGVVLFVLYTLYLCWFFHVLTSKTLCSCLGWLNTFQRS